MLIVAGISITEAVFDGTEVEKCKFHCHKCSY